MEKEEYDNKIKKNKQIYESNIQMINDQYAFSNNPYKVGDIIKDHSYKIKIESIHSYVGFMDKYPSCVYHGSMVKNDGTPFKKQTKGHIYQSNIIP